MTIKKKNYELAFEDYKNGMSYADIATKYGVAETTVRDKIRDDLLGQMRSNGVTHGHFLDLVEDYMAMWDIKNNLIADIEERGVSVKGVTG